MDLYINSIIVGIVAILSALIGGMLPNRIQNRNSLKKVKRQKLEELYLNIENWYNFAFNQMCSQFSLVLNGHIDWNGYLDLICEGKNVGDQKKVAIILYLYFSNLEVEYNQLLAAVQKTDKYINTEIKESYLKGFSLEQHRELHKRNIDEMNRCFDIFQQRTHEIAKSI